MNQTQIRQAVFYILFVNQNPSLKNYVVTMGFRTHYRSDDEIRGFCGRIQEPRRRLYIYQWALADAFTKTLNPN